jgi:hypothetical protein
MILYENEANVIENDMYIGTPLFDLFIMCWSWDKYFHLFCKIDSFCSCGLSLSGDWSAGYQMINSETHRLFIIKSVSLFIVVIDQWSILGFN